MKFNIKLMTGNMKIYNLEKIKKRKKITNITKIKMIMKMINRERNKQNKILRNNLIAEKVKYFTFHKFLTTKVNLKMDNFMKLIFDKIVTITFRSI